MLFLGLKKHQKALDCFTNAISTPSFIIHAAGVESYKKLLLLGMLIIGDAPRLPRYTSLHVRAPLDRVAEKYKMFIDIYKKD